jgi:hypothetical protein
MRIVWEQTSTREVRARRTVEGEYDSLSADTMYHVQDWCVEHDIGVRMSFDTFRFRTESDKFLFLMKWS